MKERGGVEYGRHDHNRSRSRGRQDGFRTSSPRRYRSPGRRSSSPVGEAGLHGYRNWNGKERGERRGRQEERKTRSRGDSTQFPPRPNPRDIENDKSISAKSYDEYRRLKRSRMAANCEWLIWGRSPSPMDEPLLAVAPALPKPDDTAKEKDDMRNPELDALDQEELQLFVKWLEERKAEVRKEEERRRKEEEESRPVGPSLPTTVHASDPESYGVNLRPGEGERMAAFAKQGQRIPRRGEVGLTSEQIESYEKIGYVMSGSRHSRMNAIRIRKENQVYTAEEKAALAMFNQEEAKRKEQQLTEQFKKLIDDTIKDAGEAAGGAEAAQKR